MPADPFILIVDDSAAIRQTVKGALLTMGYTNVCVAQNGADALDQCRQHAFKVIFLDWNMPEMDGLTFLKTFRNDMKVEDAAIVMLTAHGSKADILTALENGATDYVVKPASTDTIKKKMGQAVEWLEKNGGTP